MEPVHSPSKAALRYRFGPFEFRAEELDLRRKGTRVPLARQSLQLLAVFLERPDIVITRDQLREALWPEDIHLDFDAALNTAMKRLRQALEDTPARDKYIETVPRIGYRFIATVEIVRPEPGVGPVPLPEEPAASEAREAQEEPRKQLQVLLVASAVAAVAAGLVGWYLHPTVRPPAIVSRALLTSFPGEQLQPAISPDGGEIAFSWADPQRGEHASIFVTSASGAGLQQLTSNGDDSAPAWSPDGSQIAFIRYQPSAEDDVYTISSAGGTPRRITSTAGRYVAWTADGRDLIVARRTGVRSFQLLAVSVSKGDRRVLTAPDEPVDAFERFAFSPDGTKLGYAEWTGARGPAELFVRPAAGGHALQVTHLGILPQGWCWTPDSKAILTTDSQSGARRIHRLPIAPAGAQAEPLPGLGDDVTNPAAAAVGETIRLVYCQRRFTSNLYEYPIRRDPSGRVVGLDRPRAIAPATRTTANPQVSPDGRRLAFVSDRSFFNEIWASRPDGSEAHQLTSFASPRFSPGSPAWSPDSSRIAFTASHDDVDDLYIIPSDGGPAAQLTHGHFDVIRPSWSHDGRWIYFSRRENNTSQDLTLWKIPARTDASEKDAAPLLGLAGIEPIESPDGGVLYYLSGLSSGELWRIPVAGGSPTRVIASGVVRGWWAPVRGGIYYAAFQPDMKKVPPDPPAILYFDEATRTSHVLGTLAGRPYPAQRGLTVWGNQLWTDWIEISSTNLVKADLRP